MQKDVKSSEILFKLAKIFQLQGSSVLTPLTTTTHSLLLLMVKKFSFTIMTKEISKLSITVKMVLITKKAMSATSKLPLITNSSAWAYHHTEP